MVTETGAKTVNTTVELDGRMKSSPRNSTPMIMGPSGMSGGIGTKPTKDPLEFTEIEVISCPSTERTSSLLGMALPTPSVSIPSTVATSVLSISEGEVEITTCEVCVTLNARESVEPR